jgi:hypothetical protein
VVAGGGFKGGHVIGASDKTGETVADRPVRPEELLGSMCELLGIDPDGPLPNSRGLTAEVMPLTQLNGAAGVGRLTEIM